MVTGTSRRGILHWVAMKDAFCYGSGVAHALCRRFGFDPDETVKPKRFFRCKCEAWLILLAAKILEGRNVHRSPVVSRQDNNRMYGMAEKLEAIAKRISTKYP